MEDGLETRLLESVDEFRACHEIQRAAWQFSDQLIIPYTQLVTAQHHGGVVLGAFDGTTLVGFVYGYLGRHTGPPYLFSQRLGVLPTYQGRGIGERLKWAQRSRALELGLDRILWTYDPLEAPNAWLNIAKLGGVARRYERNFFGRHETPLHGDLPSDRFLVEWALQGDRVLARLEPDWSPPDADGLLAQAGPPLNAVTWDERGLPASGAADLTAERPQLAVEVPAGWQDLPAADVALAADWRAKTRLLFEHYFDLGYAVAGYARGTGDRRRRNYYRLERKR